MESSSFGLTYSALYKTIEQTGHDTCKTWPRYFRTPMLRSKLLRHRTALWPSLVQKHPAFVVNARRTKSVWTTRRATSPSISRLDNTRKYCGELVLCLTNLCAAVGELGKSVCSRAEPSHSSSRRWSRLASLSGIVSPDERKKIYPSALERIVDSAANVRARDWRSVVHNYSKRKLSFWTDCLPALSGTASRFSRNVKAQYLAGLWADDFPFCLAWRCDTLYDSPSARGQLGRHLDNGVPS